MIGLGPLTLPQYLDRPDIVTRAGANQMRLGDFSQWAEPLEPLLTRIMAEDLYALLGAKDVIPIPQRGDLPLDRVVEVDFARFDATRPARSSSTPAGASTAATARPWSPAAGRRSPSRVPRCRTTTPSSPQ